MSLLSALWPLALAGLLSETDEDPHRLEPGGVVIGAYNADLGWGGGGVLNLARFHPQLDPYRWRAQLALLLFAKGSGVGPESTFQNLSLIVDVPSRGQAPRWRFEGYVRRQSNAGWYGIGNTSAYERPWEDLDPVADPEAYALARHHNDYDRRRIGLKAAGRMDLVGDVDAFVGAAFTVNRFELYEGSRLALDLAGEGSELARQALSWGVPHSLLEGSAGVYWDHRDHETSPSRGWLLEGSVRGGVGLGRSGAFWGVNLTGRGYLPLTDHVVFATRVLLDGLGGEVPFYEQARHGGLVLENSPGGGRSVGGVALMRYHGRAKALLNLELRHQLLDFGLVGQPSRAGLTWFVDTGRVWSELPGNPEIDGGGFHTGAGGGLWLHWGDSFLLRLDVGTSAEGTGAYLDVDHVF